MAGKEKTDDTRALPHNLEAEASLLGSLLMDNAALSLVAAKIKKEHFYASANQAIYETMLELDENNVSIDLTTLSNELKRKKILDKIGGRTYLATLEEYVLSPSLVENYADIVLEKARTRQLINCAYEILDSAYNEEREIAILLDHSEQLIFDISKDTVSGDFQSIGDLTVKTLEHIEQRYRDKHEVSGLKTNYYELDEYTSGLQKSDLIILAARPSKGKTAFGLNIALRVAVKNKQPVGIFSLEMSSEQINNRLLCTLTKVPANKVRSGKMSSTDLTLLSEGGRILSEAPIYIDDTPGLTALQLRAKARRLKSRIPDLSMIIVDYLQLMHMGGRIENRQQEVAEISRSMKALARELEVPVIAISQLSRLIEQRRGKEKRPMLSDLRESGAIEQDADVVLFIHHVENPEEEEEEEGNPPDVLFKRTQIIIGKQRNGPLGDVDLLFFPEFMLFENPTREYYQ